jgi:hypothetical protein
MTAYQPESGPSLMWREYFVGVRNERLIAARALLELDPHRTVQRDAARWITDPGRDGHLTDSGEWIWDLDLDWEGWVADVDMSGRSWSGSEFGLFEIVAGLAVGRPFNVVGVLDRLGSWKLDAWQILTQWITR